MHNKIRKTMTFIDTNLKNDEIANGTILIEIFDDYLIVEDESNQSFEVYMNNLIKKMED